MSDNHQAEPSFTLTFTVSEWAMIRQGLYELPAKASVALIGKLERCLQTEIQQQQAKAREVTG